MAKIFSRFTSFITGSRSVLQDTPDIFPYPDLDHIRKQANIESKAKENGERDFPRQDATNQDAVELNIKSNLEQVRDRYTTDYNRQLEVYSERIRRYNSALDLQSINVDFQAALSNLQTEAHQEENDLFEEKNVLNSMGKEARIFREKNNLQKRRPKYPERQTRSWLIIIGLTAVESAATYSLLSDLGSPLQIAAYALLFSFINVFVPFKYFADFIRYKKHKETSKKKLGQRSLIAYILYAIVINLMMAHFRSVLIDITNTMTIIDDPNVKLIELERYLRAAVEAFSNFKNNPFGLADIWSWFLFVTGCGLSLGGLYQGLKSDDEYPGYGELHRRYEQYYSNYTEQVSETSERLTKKRDAGIDEINSLKKTLIREYGVLPEIGQNATNLKSRYLSALDRLDTLYNLLIREYRDENEKHRNTPSPDYFSDKVLLARTPIEEFIFESPKDPQEIISALNSFSSKLHTTFDEMINNLESTRKVLKEKSGDDYPFKVE